MTFRPPLNFLLLSDLHPPPLGFRIALSTYILGPFRCPPLHDHYSRDLSLTLLSCITPAKSIVHALPPLAVHLQPVQRSHPMPCAFCAPALSFALALTSHHHPHGPSSHAASFVLSPVVPDPLSWTPRFTQCPLSIQLSHVLCPLFPLGSIPFPTLYLTGTVSFYQDLPTPSEVISLHRVFETHPTTDLCSLLPINFSSPLELLFP